MKPLQVKYCYAIAHGNTDFAQQIAAEVDLFEIDNYGLNVATFGLAATHLHPKKCIAILKQLYPQIQDPLPTGHLDTTSTLETLKQILIPQVRARWVPVIGCVSKIAALDASENKELLVLLAAPALSYVLNSFEIDPKSRNVIQELRLKLKPRLLTPSTQESRTNLQQQSLKTLARFINGATSTLYDQNELEDIFSEEPSLMFSGALDRNNPTQTTISVASDIPWARGRRTHSLN